MDMLMTIIALVAFGLVFGSFSGAQVWRLRARQLEQDKKSGEKVSQKEYTQLHSLLKPFAKDRSVCLHCHHELAWYDMIPLLSWLSLGGKCRYCRHSIGSMEPLVEAGLALVFVTSYLFWPHHLDNPLEWVRFAIWLVACVLMAILFVYDAKWSLLPFGINVGLVAVAVLFVVVSFVIAPFSPNDWWSLLGGIGILSGLYYLFSLPGWVGLGDSILGLGLALLLQQWDKSFLALFIANLLGCLMLIPLAFSHKLARGAHIPFGPFLILGTIVAYLWGAQLMTAIFDWSGMLINPFMV